LPNRRRHEENIHRAIINRTAGDGWRVRAAGCARASLSRSPTRSPRDVSDRGTEGHEQLKLLWIGSGTEDTLFNSIRDFDKQLTDLGIKHTFKTNEGAHTWLVWRRYLNEIAPLLFP